MITGILGRPLAFTSSARQRPSCVSRMRLSVSQLESENITQDGLIEIDFFLSYTTLHKFCLENTHRPSKFTSRVRVISYPGY